MTGDWSGHNRNILENLTMGRNLCLCRWQRLARLNGHSKSQYGYIVITPHSALLTAPLQVTEADQQWMHFCSYCHDKFWGLFIFLLKIESTFYTLCWVSNNVRYQILLLLKYLLHNQIDKYNFFLTSNFVLLDIINNGLFVCSSVVCAFLKLCNKHRIFQEFA